MIIQKPIISTNSMKIAGIVTALVFAIIFMSITTTSLTIDLIHRDFLLSPSLLLLSSSTPSQRLINALQRSLHHRHSRPPIHILSDKGEYLIKLSIGTPPVEALAVADTGSDLTWIQCKPCPHCFRQKAPLFQPNLSSTYKPLACASTPCNAFHGRTSCNGLTNTCRYSIAYGDFSFSNGNLATETIRLGSVAFSDVVVGCGHYDGGTFGAHAVGIVGLGGGKLSLISQMESSRFSYCLGASYSGSKMSFGDDAVVAGDDVATTPLSFKTPNTFYLLTLQGISVGDERIDYYTPAVPDGEGNIIMDSGTTLTFLPKELYVQVAREVKRQMKMKEMEDPKGILNLCFASTSVALARAPDMRFHFKGGDVTLKPKNAFVKTSKNCLCLGFAPTNAEAIFGNLAQMDFLVGYDLENRTVSFKPADCSHSNFF